MCASPARDYWSTLPGQEIDTNFGSGRLLGIQEGLAVTLMIIMDHCLSYLSRFDMDVECRSA